MDSNQPKTGKYALNYGLILGGLSVAFQLMLFFADAHTAQSSLNNVIGLVLAVGVTFWGISAFKKANNGLLSIGQGLKIGAGVALISGIIAIVYLIFLSNVLDPEFASKVMDLRMAEAAEQQNLTSEQIQQGKEMGLKFWWISYPMILIVNVLIGLVIGLVGGLIFRKSEAA
ncbi:DUF4199 domain-containing protein [Robiginitalea sediminis]|uniref:DUF4199 domain-containing protein n=1 Tax=Robiginitalea sediminis TaxID=1982593 RepID=UPI000B4BCA64|nr:DUF4199 domain-containing protein [Robiginitalea sediminis]